MRKVAIAVSCIVAMALCASGAAAKTFVDKYHGFVIDFSDTWLVQPQFGPVAVVARSTEPKFPGGHCSVVAMKEAGLLSMTQAEIDATTRLPDSADWWRKSTLKGRKNPRIETIGVERHRSGLIAYYAVVTSTIPSSRGGEFDLKTWRVQMTVPGTVFEINCAVSEPDFEAMRLEFRRTIESFRLL